jgi:hypothetical protein
MSLPVRSSEDLEVKFSRNPSVDSANGVGSIKIGTCCRLWSSITLLTRHTTLCIVVGAVASNDCPFFRVEQVSKKGRVHVIAKNIAKQPILAYVVVGDSDSQHSVWKGVFTEGGMLKEGKSFERHQKCRIRIQQESLSITSNLRMVRAGGPASTEEGKGSDSKFSEMKDHGTQLSISGCLNP